MIRVHRSACCCLLPRSASKTGRTRTNISTPLSTELNWGNSCLALTTINLQRRSDLAVHLSHIAVRYASPTPPFRCSRTLQQICWTCSSRQPSPAEVSGSSPAWRHCPNSARRDIGRPEDLNEAGGIRDGDSRSTPHSLSLAHAPAVLSIFLSARVCFPSAPSSLFFLPPPRRFNLVYHAFIWSLVCLLLSARPVRPIGGLPLRMTTSCLRIHSVPELFLGCLRQMVLWEFWIFWVIWVLGSFMALVACHEAGALGKGD
jgi:hypothetical protein